jgi:elongation factor 1-gamma
MKLYNNNPGNLFTAVAAITANFAGVQLDEVVLGPEEAKGKEYKTKVLTGKFPALETEQGVLFESAAIARYIARKNTGAGLLGSNEHEASQVDQWIDFVNTALAPHNMIVYRATFGWVPVEAEVYNEALKTIKENLRVLNTHLQGKEYLVGGNVTVADIVVGIHLTIPFQIALDPGFRKAMPNVTAFFEKFVKYPQVIKRLGNVKACQKTIKPQLPPKEEKKAAAPKKEEKKDDAPAVMKETNPLDVLPPSKFDLYNFKTLFVNSPDRRGEGMKFFFENYDTEGYSIYFLHYDKYEGEGTVIYQFANLLNGFL